MGFKTAKKQLLNCLTSGHILHEARDSIDIKNHFLTGQLSREALMDILRCARGYEYEHSYHHRAPSIEVHIVRTRYLGESWYVYLAPNCVFISVHN